MLEKLTYFSLTLLLYQQLILENLYSTYFSITFDYFNFSPFKFSDYTSY